MYKSHNAGWVTYWARQCLSDGEFSIKMYVVGFEF